ncbi:MAG: aminotransferase class V-fold PLP-dependent enzyme [Simkaniaceae bacterium]
MIDSTNQILKKPLEELYRFLGVPLSVKFFPHQGRATSYAALLHSQHISTMHETGRNHVLFASHSPATAHLKLQQLKRVGVVGKEIPLSNEGLITPEAVDEAINPRTTLVSFPLIDHLTGVIHPIEEIAEVCHKRGVYLHLDLSYSLGILHFHLNDYPVDYLTIPEGLFVKPYVPFEPLIPGDSISSFELTQIQERLKRLKEKNELQNFELTRLRDFFETEIRDHIPGAFPFFTLKERMPHISALAFPGITAEALLFYLTAEQIHASMGGDEDLLLETLLKKARVDDMTARSALSFKIHPKMTKEGIKGTVQKIKKCVLSLRALSGVLPV